MTNIDQALDYIYSFINLEKSEDKYNKDNIYSLDKIKILLKKFNSPEKDQKIIHIAGTKGKGSTAILLSKLLTESGFNVTTFLSPHLINPNERFLYNLKDGITILR